MRRPVIGVMGGAQADAGTCRLAYRLGELIAEAGCVLLNGGRPCGVMEHSARGAKSRGGLTVGILPGGSAGEASTSVDVAVATGMGDARNAINVLSSDAVIACPGGAGTLSEIALALKNGKRVVALGFWPGEAFSPWSRAGLLTRAETPEDALRQALSHLESRRLAAD